jgi:hypothetical protein
MTETPRPPKTLTPARLAELKREIRREDVHLLYAGKIVLELLTHIDALTAALEKSDYAKQYQASLVEAMYKTNEELEDKVDSLTAEVAALRAEKHGAYDERNRLVCVLSKLWPAHLSRHPDDDLTWDDEWRWIVCLHTPVGQAAWHIKDSEREGFNHLDVRPNDWDGHSTPEKYLRLEALREAPLSKEPGEDQ